MKLFRLPSLIDIHVHLRDPGQTHKEDFYSGTEAALAGGITTVLDMPNNIVPILDEEKLDAKIAIAQNKAVCNFGFYFGTNGKNISEFEKVSSKVVGLKLYLNQTTGNLQIEEESLLEQIFKAWKKTKVIIVHAEDNKIDAILSLCSLYKNKLHITHVSTRKSLQKIIQAKSEGVPVTCDVTPHHLFFTKTDLTYLDAFGSVKPSLENQSDVDFIWDNISSVDCIATDHAPHTIAEKKSFDPPFGMPGLETMVPLMLTAISQKRLTIDDLIRLLHTNPTRIFNLAIDTNTYIEVDLDEEYSLNEEKLYTKCKWSPFVKMKFKGRVKKVFLNGVLAFNEGKIMVDKGFGKHIFTKN